METPGAALCMEDTQVSAALSTVNIQGGAYLYMECTLDSSALSRANN